MLIEDYGIIGDAGSVALINREGSIDWLCWPEFHSPSLFARLLDDEEGGYCKLAPQDLEGISIERRYVPDTAVLQTDFAGAEGVLRVTDFMVAWRPSEKEELRPDHRIVRRAECLSGKTKVRFVCDLRPDFARRVEPPRYRGRMGYFYEFGPHVVVVQGEVPLALVDGQVVAEFELQQGDVVRFALDYDQGTVAHMCPLGEFADQELDETRAFWTSWADRCKAQGPHREQLVRSLITLKLLTQSSTGAIVAGATTSLPEEIGGTRNWDYRYCWIRDAVFSLRAFASMGFRREAESFFDWMIHAVGPKIRSLHIVYDVFGNKTPTEVELTHLRGFSGSRPVRAGNAASHQFQLDIYGEVLVAAEEYVQHGGTLDEWQKKQLLSLGRGILRDYQEPDAGIWEKRSERRRHTHSLLLCWCGLTSIENLRNRGHLECSSKDASSFREARDRITETIENECFDPHAGTYVSETHGTDVDAALLKLALNGFVEADSPRMQKTYERLARELSNGAHLYRYHTQGDSHDGLEGHEGAFFLCSFWAVEYLALAGRVEEAREKFDELMKSGNDLGLFSEEFDPERERLLGNFPQAFTHVGVINACARVEPSTHAQPPSPTGGRSRQRPPGGRPHLDKGEPPSRVGVAG